MKSFREYDRFDLEQDIIQLWGLAELIDEFLRQYQDNETAFTEDDVYNKLNGIKEVMNLRGQRLWDGFETMLATKQFVKLKDPKNGKEPT
jgi:hypothetical protein